MGAQAPSNLPAGNHTPTETPMATVAGWLLIAFGVIPLLMGIKGDGPTYLYTGVGAVGVGAVALLLSRLIRRN